MESTYRIVPRGMFWISLSILTIGLVVSLVCSLCTGEEVAPVFYGGVFVFGVADIIVFCYALAEFASSYTISPERLIIRSGILTRSVLNVEFSSVRDTVVIQSLDGMLFKRYTVAIISSDSARPAAQIQWIRKSQVDEIIGAIRYAQASKK